MLSSAIPDHSYFLTSGLLRQHQYRRVFPSAQALPPTISRIARKATVLGNDTITGSAGSPGTVLDSAAAFADDMTHAASRPTAPKNLTASDPGLQSTWGHRAWVAAGCSSILVSLSKSFTYSPATSVHLAESMVAALLGYFLADLGSGIYHWAIDNYGDASTPIFGSQIEAFQGHHRWPWTITCRQFANNIHSLARVVALAMLPVDVAVADPLWHSFISVFSGCILFSQQFHAWAHGTKSRLPAPVVMLQDAGLLVSRQRHADHHRPPYNGNYCIVSGVWNAFLDRHSIFQVAEMVIFFRFGIRPRSWKEPTLEWQEHDSTTESNIPSGGDVLEATSECSNSTEPCISSLKEVSSYVPNISRSVKTRLNDLSNV